MTGIIYFITPQSLIKLGTKAAEFVPILGPIVEYNKKAKKATKAADPVGAATQGIDLLFKHCFGKPAALSVECTLWISLSVVGGLTANPGLIATGAQFGNMILDELID